jgi:hypothetical protein
VHLNDNTHIQSKTVSEYKEDFSRSTPRSKEINYYQSSGTTDFGVKISLQ